jgi:hypothetical protein
MARLFSNPTFYNSGKPTFSNLSESSFASDYILNKKAKLLYKDTQFKKSISSYNNYFLFERAKLIRDLEMCDNLSAFNTGNLISNLYSTENFAESVNVVTDASNIDIYCDEFTPAIVDVEIGPFYQNYNIDPCGVLFGNSVCGYKNYLAYRVINKPVAISNSLIKCIPLCSLK